MKNNALRAGLLPPPYESPTCVEINLTTETVLCGSIQSGTGSNWGTLSVDEPNQMAF